jgi:hypothetical protein
MNVKRAGDYRQPSSYNCNFIVFSRAFFGIDFSLLHFCTRL